MISFRSRFALAALLAASLSMAQAAPVGAAARLIERLGMEKIPVEGCWFKVTYTSADKLEAAALPARYGSPRTAGGAIYALLTNEDFSAMHKLKTDELWHFYQGDPIELLLLHPDGRSEVVVLGSDLLAGQHPQYTAPAGSWMGARSLTKGEAAYGFFGTTMAPGFDYDDFEIGYREELQRQYPERRELIAALTRADHITRPATAATSAPAEAASQPTVFLPTAVKPVSFGPGVELRELVGLVGHAKTARASVAAFTLGPGKTTGMSYMKTGEEYFLVTKGRGTVVVGEQSSPVVPGTVVFLGAGIVHSLTAAGDSELEFYAVSSPAFDPKDYVPVAD
jgi:predicted cupin superfamily sugar epimerase/mannose-6-phosphate isomerase-like protein (cupin superfamily)